MHSLPKRDFVWVGPCTVSTKRLTLEGLGGDETCFGRVQFWETCTAPKCDSFILGPCAGFVLGGRARPPKKMGALRGPQSGRSSSRVRLGLECDDFRISGF